MSTYAETLPTIEATPFDPSGTVLGIDPGLTGAVAVLSLDGRLLEVVDLPTATTGNKTVLDDSAVVEVVARLSPSVRLAVLEKVGGRPGQSAPAAFVFGSVCGFLRAALVCRNVPHELITPGRWQNAIMYGCARGKDAARMKAIQLHPQHRALFKRKNDHNRADAVLMAEYGRRYLLGIGR
jgi:crossover junction endodeoxyribonuclease RuvC